MKVNNRTITIGADPEFFIGKNGKPTSAYGLIQGTKKKPLKVEKGAVQVDGMALEFNIDPAETEEEFLNNLDVVQKQLLEMIPGFEQLKEASVTFDMQLFGVQPLQATALGCEPDFNGQTNMPNIMDPALQFFPMRTAGGHVHIGGLDTNDTYSTNHMQLCCDLAQLMDEQVGVYSVLWDKDDKRRQMYGQASAFRPKKYGMEYRTMSNAWIFNKKISSLVFQFTKDAVERLFDPDRRPVNENIFRIINESDRNDEFFKHNEKADMVMEALA